MSETWYFYMYIHVLKIILIALIPWSCWDSCWMLNRTQAWNRKQNVITLNLGGSPLSLPPLLTRTSCGVVLPLLQILLYFCWFYIGRYTSFERSMSCLGISMSALLLGCDSQKLVSEIKFFSSVFHMDFLDKFVSKIRFRLCDSSRCFWWFFAGVRTSFREVQHECGSASVQTQNK